MNREEFRKSVADLRGLKVDAKKMQVWFDGVLRTLEALGDQKEAIGHPGHRGTARESPLQDVLNEMLPQGIVAAKGFALTPLMAASKEQDLLTVDRNVAGTVLPGESLHYPIEACLASMQVKSRLTRSTIREAIVNCVSLKGLGMFEEDARWHSKNDGLCYAVFGYGSDFDLTRLAEVINEELEEVDRDLWPNLFYVLGNGLLIPADDQGAISLGNETMFTGAKFRTVTPMGVEPALAESEAYPFLWFLTNFIDHCTSERELRKSPRYKQYWLRLFTLHGKLKKERGV